MSVLLKHIDGILSMDVATLVVIAVLCAAASWIIKEYLSNPLMFMVVFPVLFCISVLIQYAFILGEFYAPNRIDQWLMWTILAGIGGTVLGTVIVGLCCMLQEARRKPFKPRPDPAVRRAAGLD
ncbi:MAG TPA: hypothetical protein VG900_00285 [Hyphomicrobiaceae bacterium]|jgi:hypothetical protein|nr:hypothetical protein [Hyphomicrobiaceae bacterium]